MDGVGVCVCVRCLTARIHVNPARFTSELRRRALWETYLDRRLDRPVDRPARRPAGYLSLCSSPEPANGSYIASIKWSSLCPRTLLVSYTARRRNATRPSSWVASGGVNRPWLSESNLALFAMVYDCPLTSGHRVSPARCLHSTFSEIPQNLFLTKIPNN